MLKEFTGHTTVPMERMGYDPELDFETRHPEEWEKPKPKTIHSAVEFEDTEAAVQMYVNGASVSAVAKANKMGGATCRRLLVDNGVEIRGRGGIKSLQKRK